MEILLVEDQILIALANARRLRTAGHNVITAHSAIEAINIFKMREKLDLVILDINLGPGINGLELGELIKKEYDLPILFMSSNEEPEIIEKAERISGNKYIFKNVDTPMFESAIRETILNGNGWGKQGIKDL